VGVVRYVTFRNVDGIAQMGHLEGGQVVPLEGVDPIGASTDMDALAAARRGSPIGPLESVRLLPASPRPGKVFCVGLNYKAHIEESGRDLPTYPVLFPKFASNLIADGDDIQLPPEAEQADYEAELAVVIGRGGRRISREAAIDHVLGYTICNDITMRDYQYKTHQWMQGKAWDGSTPLGPIIVTPDEVDVSDLRISMRLNGEVMQDSTTSLLIFDVAELVSTVSTFTALEPGDVILTGTPSGVGFRRDPKVLLQDGDVVEVEISGLGTLRNVVRTEDV
jgi:acylpyruvate hydrolase